MLGRNGGPERVHLFLVVTQIDSLLLGYNFYFESPAWLFEPFFIAYCLAAGLLNAHLLGRWTRSSKRSWPVPVCAVGFFRAWSGPSLAVRLRP
ncbi:hypothetical protein [Streptomyces sp. NPDC046161]|uniref:hypothetical protein n=1 Tax=Streptomyces sp. NPDC046161 TaxID=3155132 RepID=UPI0033CD5ACC